MDGPAEVLAALGADETSELRNDEAPGADGLLEPLLNTACGWARERSEKGELRCALALDEPDTPASLDAWYMRRMCLMGVSS